MNKRIFLVLLSLFSSFNLISHEGDGFHNHSYDFKKLPQDIILNVYFAGELGCEKVCFRIVNKSNKSVFISHGVSKGTLLRLYISSDEVGKTQLSGQKLLRINNNLGKRIKVPIHHKKIIKEIKANSAYEATFPISDYLKPDLKLPINKVEINAKVKFLWGNTLQSVYNIVSESYKTNTVISADSLRKSKKLNESFRVISLTNTKEKK